MTNARGAVLLAAGLLVAWSGCEPTEKAIDYDRTFYRLEARIEPAERLVEVEGVIHFVAPRNDCGNGRFQLNRNARLESFLSERVKGYRFDTRARVDPPSAGAIYFAFHEPLDSGESVPIRVVYQMYLPAGDSVADFRLNDEWGELNRRSSWFPISPETGPFAFELTLSLPEGYQARSNCAYTFRGDEWVFRSELPAEDIPLFVSRDLRTTQLNRRDLRARAHYATLEDSTADRMVVDLSETLHDLRKRFPRHAPTAWTTTAAPRKGASYAARGLFVLAGAPDSMYAAEREKIIAAYAEEATARMFERSGADEEVVEALSAAVAARTVRTMFGEARYRARVDSLEAIVESEAAIANYGFRSERDARAKARAALAALEFAEEVGERRFTLLCERALQSGGATLETLGAQASEIAGEERTFDFRQ